MAAIGRYAFFLRFYNDSRSAILQTIICTQEKRFLLAGGFGAYPEKVADECVDCATSCRGIPKEEPRAISSAIATRPTAFVFRERVNEWASPT